jgi:hypothetical protein
MSTSPDAPGPSRSGGEVNLSRTVLAACWLLCTECVLMVVWGACTLSRAGEFAAAVDRFGATHSDVDLPGIISVAFVAGAIASIVLGVIFALTGLLGLRGARGTRPVTWLTAGAALPFVYATYQRLGEPYMFPGDMRQMCQAPMRALTPWRFSGWYHAVTVGLGDVIVACLLLVSVLLVLPASGQHFRGK